MQINATIGERVRSRRQHLGLSQAGLAGALDVSPQAVSKWERGENGPDLGLLVPLARTLGVSTDWLLGYSTGTEGNLMATVICSSLPGYTARSQTLAPAEVLAWINGVFYQITESMLHHDGIPIKYLGDGFLGFFSGSDHQRRGLAAAREAVRSASEPVVLALHTGPVFLGACGHPDYARTDLLGTTVNVCFRLQQWAESISARIIASAVTVTAAGEEVGEAELVTLKGVEKPIGVHRLQVR